MNQSLGNSCVLSTITKDSRNFHNCVCNSDTCPFKINSVFVIKSHVGPQYTVLPSSEAFICTSALETHKCANCNFKTHSMIGFNEHAKMVKKLGPESRALLEANILESYSCRDCNFETFSLLLLLKHVKCLNRRCSGAKQAPLKRIHCKHCSFSTRSRHRSHIHIVKKHIKWFDCIALAEPVEVEQEIQLETQSSDVELFDCTRLEAQLRKNQERSRRFKCLQCSFRAAQPSDVRHHVIAKHVQWFKCDQCSYKTTWSKNINRHVLAKHMAVGGNNWLDHFMKFLDPGPHVKVFSYENKVIDMNYLQGR